MACKSHKSEVSDTATNSTSVGAEYVPSDFKLELTRTACFGQCPAYSLSVNAEGVVEWQGELFVERKGKYAGKVSRSAVSSLYKRIQQSGFQQMKDNYDNPGISDLPSTIIALEADGKRKKVVCRYDCPPEFQTLFKQLEAGIDTSGLRPSGSK